jgi:predicted DNA-binding protein
MARPKTKDAEARSFRIRKDLGARLDDYSDLSHIPKTTIVELALEEYLDKVAPAKKTATK